MEVVLNRPESFAGDVEEEVEKQTHCTVANCWQENLCWKLDFLFTVLCFKNKIPREKMGLGSKLHISPTSNSFSKKYSLRPTKTVQLENFEHTSSCHK
jgi:hypothetical protein